MLLVSFGMRVAAPRKLQLQGSVLEIMCCHGSAIGSAIFTVRSQGQPGLTTGSLNAARIEKLDGCGQGSACKVSIDNGTTSSGQNGSAQSMQ